MASLSSPSVKLPLFCNLGRRRRCVQDRHNPLISLMMVMGAGGRGVGAVAVASLGVDDATHDRVVGVDTTELL